MLYQCQIINIAIGMLQIVENYLLAVRKTVGIFPIYLRVRPLWWPYIEFKKFIYSTLAIYPRFEYAF